MAEIVGFPEAFVVVLAEVAPVLDERARRLLLGAGARQLGRGGITLIAVEPGSAKGVKIRVATRGQSSIVVDKSDSTATRCGGRARCGLPLVSHVGRRVPQDTVHDGLRAQVRIAAAGIRSPRRRS